MLVDVERVVADLRSVGARRAGSLDAAVVVSRARVLWPAGILQAVRVQVRDASTDGPCASGDTNDRDDLVFAVDEARRVDAGALDGFLPERYPLVIYGRDRPFPPPDARILAVDSGGHPALFQVGANALGFTAHLGVKAAIIEDLIMEFEEAPADPGPTLARLREVQTALEDALVPIMTGVVRILRLMD